MPLPARLNKDLLFHIIHNMNKSMKGKMKNLFDKPAFDEIVERINKLSPGSQRQWGKMNVDQMLAHCVISLQAASGEKYFPPRLIGKLIGRFLKFTIMKERPVPKNSPTNPAFVITETAGFEKEKERLLQLVNNFHTGGEAKCTTNPHSFFCKLTPVQWGTLMYKHLDHHLKQFGV
jgi:hypothetical protein